MIQTPERENLRDKIQSRMLSGTPFTRSGLCRDFRDRNPALYHEQNAFTLIGVLITNLSKAKKIAGERKGRTFIWRATNGT